VVDAIMVEMTVVEAAEQESFFRHHGFQVGMRGF
jgi:hypothetical protein